MFKIENGRKLYVIDNFIVIDLQLSLYALLPSDERRELKDIDDLSDNMRLLITSLNNTNKLFFYPMHIDKDGAIFCIKRDYNVITQQKGSVRIFLYTSYRSGVSVILSNEMIKSNKHSVSDHLKLINTGITSIKEAGEELSAVHTPLSQVEIVKPETQDPIEASFLTRSTEITSALRDLASVVAKQSKHLKEYIPILSKCYIFSNEQELSQHDLMLPLVQMVGQENARVWLSNDNGQLNFCVIFGQSDMPHRFLLNVKSKSQFFKVLINTLLSAIDLHGLAKRRVLMFFALSFSVKPEYMWPAIQALNLPEAQPIDRKTLNTLVELAINYSDQEVTTGSTQCIIELFLHPLVTNHLSMIEISIANKMMERILKLAEATQLKDVLFSLIDRANFNNLELVFSTCTEKELLMLAGKLKNAESMSKLRAIISWVNRNSQQLQNSSVIQLLNKLDISLHAFNEADVESVINLVSPSIRHLFEGFLPFSRFSAIRVASQVVAPLRAFTARNHKSSAAVAPIKLSSKIILGWQRDLNLMNNQPKNDFFNETPCRKMAGVIAVHLKLCMDGDGKVICDDNITLDLLYKLFEFCMYRSVNFFTWVVLHATLKDLKFIGDLLRKMNEPRFLTLGCFGVNYAALSKNIERVELTLSWGLSREAILPEGLSVLALALLPAPSKANFEPPEKVYPIVKLLLDGGVDPNACNSDGCTALHYTGMSCFGDIAKLLLSRGAHPTPMTFRDTYGPYFTPLDVAVGQGNNVVKDILLKHGALLSAGGNAGLDKFEGIPGPFNQRQATDNCRNANKCSSHLGGIIVNSPPGNEEFERNRCDEIMALTVNPSFSINCRAKNFTLMDLAVISRNHVLIKWFLEKFNVNLNITIPDDVSDNDIKNASSYIGDTCLHIAIKGGQDFIAKQLMEYGADLYFPDITGDTFLHRLARAGKIFMMRSLVIDYRFEPGTKNQDGQQVTEVFSDISLIKKFKQICVIMNMLRSPSGYICEEILVSSSYPGLFSKESQKVSNKEFIEAIDQGNHEVFMSLLEKLPKFVIAYKASIGSALHLACLLGRYKMIDALLNLNIFDLLDPCQTGGYIALELFIRSHFDLQSIFSSEEKLDDALPCLEKIVISTKKAAEQAKEKPLKESISDLLSVYDNLRAINVESEKFDPEVNLSKAQRKLELAIIAFNLSTINLNQARHDAQENDSQRYRNNHKRAIAQKALANNNVNVAKQEILLAKDKRLQEMITSTYNFVRNLRDTSAPFLPLDDLAQIQTLAQGLTRG